MTNGQGEPVGLAGFDYDRALQLHYRVFSQEQRDRIREARVTMLGLGGASTAMALIRACSGIADSRLADRASYTENEPS